MTDEEIRETALRTGQFRPSMDEAIAVLRDESASESAKRIAGWHLMKCTTEGAGGREYLGELLSANKGLV